MPCTYLGRPGTHNEGTIYVSAWIRHALLRAYVLQGSQPRRRTSRSPCHPRTRCAFVYFYIRRQYSRHFKFSRPASGIGRTARLFIGPPKENLIFISISYVNQGKQNQPPFEFRLNSNGGWFCVGWKHFCQCVRETRRWDEGSGFRFKFGAHA